MHYETKVDILVHVFLPLICILLTTIILLTMDWVTQWVTCRSALYYKSLGIKSLPSLNDLDKVATAVSVDTQYRQSHDTQSFEIVIFLHITQYNMEHLKKVVKM